MTKKNNQVTYQADYFLDKNKDYVVAEHQALLDASECPFVANLFPRIEDSSKQSKFTSIGTRFKVCFWLKKWVYCVLSFINPNSEYIGCKSSNNYSR